MSFGRITRVLATALLVAAPSKTLAQSAPDLFQRALRAERVEGDLEAAVRLYEQVAELGDRDLSARALLRMASSLEQIGGPASEEATAVYARLIRDYPDQTEAIEDARRRLSALRPAPESADPSNPGLVARRVWDKGGSWGFTVGALSPDGSEIAGVLWKINRPGNTGDLIVVDVATGALRVVGETKAGSRENPGGDTYVVGYVWSPDGTQLAYSEWTFGEEPNDHQVLHVVNRDGTGHRIASDNPQYRDIRPRSWSSDGKWIVALITGWDDVARIGTISLEDGSVSIVKTLRNGFTPPQRDRIALDLSPDDRFVAYAYGPAPGDDPDVHVLAVDGSGEAVVAAHSATEVNPLWTPDGSRLVFLSDRSGAADFWAVEMSEGKAVGDPYIVHPQVGPVVPMGFTDDGALTYTVAVPLGQHGIVELDERAAHLETATPLTERFAGSNADPVWSPDGTRIAFFSGRAEAGLERNRYLVVKSLEDGSERDFELDMGLFIGGHHSRPQWSADSRSLIFQGVHIERSPTGVTSRPSGYRIDIDTGEIHQEPHMWSTQSLGLDVTGRQSDRLRALGIRIDGFRFVSEAIHDGHDSLRPGERLLWMRDRMGWERAYECDPEQVYEGAVCIAMGTGLLIEPIVGDPNVADLHRWRLSPDGGRIAYFLRDEQDLSKRNLWVRSVSMDDEPLLLVSGAACSCELNWTPDGRYVLYMESARDGTVPAPVRRVSAEGGASVELSWELTGQQLAGMSFDPQGRRAVMPLVPEGYVRADFWSLSGFPWQESGSR